MSELLDNTENLERVMQELGDILLRHLGVLPDVALVLRVGEQCRTLFAANPLNVIPDEDFRLTLGSMLQQAVAQNLRRQARH